MKFLPLPMTIVLLVLALMVQAQMAVHKDADLTLFEKLCDVNRQWEKYEAYRSKLTTTAPFASDIQLIQTHLMLVADHLEKNTPAHLNEQQRTARSRAIQTLRNYALRGQFPINLYHTHRQPYFIDHRGTACAVGYLMLQEKAFAPAARAIARENNYAYIHDLTGLAALHDFSTYTGLTIDEMAWIQPAYSQPPTLKWNAELKSIDGQVHVLHPVENSSGILVGGDFTRVNGNTVNGIFTYKDQTVYPLGSGIEGAVKSMIYFNGQLVVGGEFAYTSNNTSFSHIARWDGSQWHADMGIAGARVNDLIVYNNELYAAGAFVFGFNPHDTTGLMKWTGSQWDIPQHLVKGEVYDLYQHDGKLYIGGDFDVIGVDSGYHHIAVMEGSNGFKKIAGGLDMPVNTIVMNDTVLMTGTDVRRDAAQNKLQGGLYYLHGGKKWLNRIGFMNWYFQGDSGSFRTLSMQDGKLSVAGEFIYYPMYGHIGQNILTYKQKHRTLQGLAYGLNGPVNATLYHNDRFYIGGAFSAIDTLQAGALASVKGLDSILASSGHFLHSSPVQLKTYPNPVSDRFQVDFPVHFQQYESIRLSVLSATGQQVKSWAWHPAGETPIFEVSDLENGVYFIRVYRGQKALGNASLIIYR